MKFSKRRMQLVPCFCIFLLNNAIANGGCTDGGRKPGWMGEGHGGLAEWIEKKA
jgi:hypothetical protein